MLHMKNKSRKLNKGHLVFFIFATFFSFFIFVSIEQGFFNQFSMKDTNPIETDTGKRRDKILMHNHMSLAIDEPIFDRNENFSWQIISLSEIFDKYHSRTLNTCRNKCDADEPLCAVKSVEEWNDLVEKSKLPYIPLLTHFQYIYPFEREYMSSPPLSDVKKLPDLKMSKVSVTGAKNDVVRCQVNDVINGRVDLVDGYGEQRMEGGDEVRVWITDKKTKEYRVAGQTKDLNNGSYSLSLKCLWPGEADLHVAVSYPREFIRTAIFQTHLGCTRYFTGQFKNNEASEDTICFSTPNIPGRPCLCNFTNDHKQHSFYCGRPLDPRLNCNNWIGTTSMAVPKPINLTSAEKEMIENIPGAASKRSIDHKIKVITDSSGQLPPIAPCAKTSLNVTWATTEACQGYWSLGLKWNYLLCKRPKWTKHWVLSCLRDMNVLFIGDYSTLQLFTVLSEVTESEFFSPDAIPWPWRGRRQNREYNLTISFSPHDYPLYFGTIPTDSLLYGSVAQQIDEIPSSGINIVVIHFYLHLTPSHLSTAHLRLIAARDAMVLLLIRNPEVLLVFRGPHTSSFDWDFNHAVGGDTLGRFYTNIILEVFQNFTDKILFLDGWEMTVALENPFFSYN